MSAPPHVNVSNVVKALNMAFKIIKLALVLANCVPFFPCWNVISLILLWTVAFVAGYHGNEMDNDEALSLVLPYVIIVMQLFVYSLMMLSCFA